MAIKTLTEVLNSISIEDIDKSSMSESDYNSRINTLLSNGYSYVGLQSNGSSVCGNLLSFKRVQNFSVDTILVKSDEIDDGNYGKVDGEIKKNHPTYKEKGTFFGLKYDHTENGFYTNEVNFFGEGLAKDVWFDRMGINAKPIPKHVYVKAHPHKENKFQIPGTFYVGSGEHAMVFIGDNSIVSSFPVYVLGKSSDWHVEGRSAGSYGALPNSSFARRYSTCQTCTTLGMTPSGYMGQDKREDYRSGWNESLYSASQEVSVTGSIYNPSPQSVSIDKFMENSPSYAAPTFDITRTNGTYLTGYASTNDFKSGYSHSGYDFLNAEEYNLS